MLTSPARYLIAVVVGCLAAPQAGAIELTDVFRSQREGVKLLLPRTWDHVRGLAGTLVASSAPGGGFRSNINLVVEKLRYSLTPQQYARQVEVTLRRTLSDVQIIRRGKLLTASKKALRWLEFEHRMGRTQLQVVTFVTTSGRKAYVLTGTSEAERYAKVLEVFTQVARSFDL